MEERRRLHKLVPTLPKNRTYLLACFLHYVVVQNGLVFDGANHGVQVGKAMFRHDIVESVMRLPDYQIFKPSRVGNGGYQTSYNNTNGTYSITWTTA